MDNDATRCFLFNKGMFNDLELKNVVGGTLYDAVREGRWTLDLFEQCATAATADLDGNNVMDREDRWGWCTDDNNAFFYLNAAGRMLFEKDESDTPQFTGNTEDVLNRLSRIITMMNSGFAYFFSNAYNEAIPYFRDGTLLFYSPQLGNIPLLRTMEFDFGVLPLPKFDAAQERYYSPVTAYGSNAITIPVTASDVDRTATIIEALSCESMYTVTPAYIDVALEGKMLRDEESADMLKIILNTTVFELGYMWSWGSVCKTVASAATNNRPNLASSFTAISRAVERNIQTTMDAIAAAGN